MKQAIIEALLLMPFIFAGAFISSIIVKQVRKLIRRGDEMEIRLNWIKIYKKNEILSLTNTIWQDMTLKKAREVALEFVQRLGYENYFIYGFFSGNSKEKEGFIFADKNDWIYDEKISLDEKINNLKIELNNQRSEKGISEKNYNLLIEEMDSLFKKKEV